MKFIRKQVDEIKKPFLMEIKLILIQLEKGKL